MIFDLANPGTPTAIVTDGVILGNFQGELEAVAFTGEDCEGYGDAEGLAGGYGIEEAGYGDPCEVPSWFLVSVLETSRAQSVIGDFLSSDGEQFAREDGGELVVISTVDELPVGPLLISIRPNGLAGWLDAYSGVLEQGTNVEPDLDLGVITFVAPAVSQIGPADVRIQGPTLDVELPEFLSYVSGSRRSGVRDIKSYFPGQYARPRYEPSTGDE